MEENSSNLLYDDSNNYLYIILVTRNITKDFSHYPNQNERAKWWESISHPGGYKENKTRSTHDAGYLSKQW